MESPYRSNANTRKGIDLDALDPKRRMRIQKLRRAHDEIHSMTTRIEAEMKHYPLEINIGDNYRAVLVMKSELYVFLDNIEAEIQRLSDPREIIWDHMNLLSGHKSGPEPFIIQTQNTIKHWLRNLFS